MKKIIINNNLFNEAIKTIKGTLAVDDSRPVLKKCQCEVDTKYVRFKSVDGYCGTIIKIEHHCDNVEKFDFVFNPFLIDYDKTYCKTITVEKLDNHVSFKWLDKDLNAVEKIVNDNNDPFIDLDGVYRNSRSDESTSIYFDKNLLLKALKGFAKDRIVKITFGDPEKPIFIKNQDTSVGEIEKIVLPVRMGDEK